MGKEPIEDLPALSETLRRDLLEAGVYPSLLDEIARSGIDEAGLRALLAWARQDQPGNPAPLFVVRVRAKVPAPEIYRQPPCERCGKHGAHAPDCPQRYAEGPFAEFYR